MANQQQVLTSLQANLNSTEKQLIADAYQFSEEILGQKSRLSGETWFDHCVNTAVLIKQIGLDADAIAAALLHDVFELSEMEIDELAEKTNSEVALLVDGLKSIKTATTKLQGFDVDLEDFRRLIIKSTDDIRILLIRIAEKVDGIKTAGHLPLESRQAVAKRAQKIYAVLCEYLNLGSWQRILQDQAFAILLPEEHKLINDSIAENLDKYDKTLTNLVSEIKDLLKERSVELKDISYRRKGVYSAYKKVRNKYLSKGETLTKETVLKLNDLLGIRIILDEPEDCYLALGLLHANYKYDPDEFDDYIVKPRPSGYQSIHSSIQFGAEWIDVQIRTDEMHEFAEFGPASHVAYKLGGNADYSWMKDLTIWQKDSDADDAKSNYKIKAFADSKFLFTPKGKVIRVSKDGSVLDFAFQIHTELGLHYKGALVNNKMVSMEFKPETGDVVEVITGKHATVTSNWLDCANMNYTKSKIRRFLKNKFKQHEHHL